MRLTARDLVNCYWFTVDNYVATVVDHVATALGAARAGKGRSGSDSAAPLTRLPASSRLLDGVGDRALTVLHHCGYDVATALRVWSGEAPVPAAVAGLIQDAVGPNRTGLLATTFVEGQRRTVNGGRCGFVAANIRRSVCVCPGIAR